MTTMRFAVDNDFLLTNVEAIPSIISVSFSPASLSLGENLGQRASVTVQCKDHRHVFAGEPAESGTFWGKFRARYGLRLRGRQLRLIRGIEGAPFQDTRYYTIEETNGPDTDGYYKIIAKDVLKLADDDRTVCPRLSNGFLSTDMTAAVTSVVISPSGIGNAEYPASGHVAIGAKEICAFTRSGDVLTLTRAQFGTIAQTHTAQDRVQVCQFYNGLDPAIILRDLLITFAGVSSSYINLTEWQNESSSFLGVVYTSVIAEPTGVAKLCSELIEQMAGAMWWDDVAQKLRLQILRAISTTAFIYDESNTAADSLEVEEQPDKRISQVQVYFGKTNPLVKDDEDDNYRCTARVSDPVAVAEYGGEIIKKIRSRWITTGGRATATILANKQLGRYRDPPRRFKFDVVFGATETPQLGAGYQIGRQFFQDIAGAPVLVPIQLVRVNPGVDYYQCEAEEMLWTPYGGDVSPTTKTIVFEISENNVVLRARHDQLYPAPASGNIINAYINLGVIIGSTDRTTPAFHIGNWPAGVTINLIVSGTIQGKGGEGGAGGAATFATVTAGFPGGLGGAALFTRYPINLTSTGALVWGGGGGGGGSGAFSDGSSNAVGGNGGGGGAGNNGGPPGAGGFGTTTTGGQGSFGVGNAGGAPGTGGAAGGGFGGGPGNPGTTATNSTSAGGVAGQPGAGIDGISFVTHVGTPGDIRGPQIN